MKFSVQSISSRLLLGLSATMSERMKSAACWLKGLKDLDLLLALMVRM